MNTKKLDFSIANNPDNASGTYIRIIKMGLKYKLLLTLGIISIFFCSRVSIMDAYSDR